MMRSSLFRLSAVPLFRYNSSIMTQRNIDLSRRYFITRTAKTALGGWAALHLPGLAWAEAAISEPRSRAALTSEGTRADTVFAALKLIEPEIKKTLARKKRVVIKPNMVMANNQLAASHADCVEAILEVLSPLYKDEFIIMDSPAGGPVTRAYENYDYYRLQKKYKVKYLDLDEEPVVIRHAIDQGYRPHAVRMSKLLLDPETYIVSAAVLKTHDRAIITLSLKNVIVGSAKKDATFRWGQPGTGNNDKMFIHGGPNNEGIHFNLFQLARQIKPDLAVIDGWQGMEGNGPCAGSAIEHRVAVASTDWLAADRIGCELMGFDFKQVGYLTFAAKAGMGQADLNQIEIVGDKVQTHLKHYKPHDNIAQQLEWMKRT